MVKAKSTSDSDSGRFLSRPRVISNTNKSVSVPAVFVVLGIWFVIFHQTDHHFFYYFLTSKSLCFSNLILFLGNRRI